MIVSNGLRRELGSISPQSLSYDVAGTIDYLRIRNTLVMSVNTLSIRRHSLCY